MDKHEIFTFIIIGCGTAALILSIINLILMSSFPNDIATTKMMSILIIIKALSWA